MFSLCPLEEVLMIFAALKNIFTVRENDSTIPVSVGQVTHLVSGRGP